MALSRQSSQPALARPMNFHKLGMLARVHCLLPEHARGSYRSRLSTPRSGSGGPHTPYSAVTPNFRAVVKHKNEHSLEFM